MRLTPSVRNLLRPACPVYVHKLGDFSSLSFSPDPQVTPVGTFSEVNSPELVKAFSTEPDKFEPQQLIERPDVFRENRRFLPIAQQFLKKNIHNCPIFSSLAAVEDKTHFFHIYDLRCPPTIGRIPEVDDILGTVEIEDGKIVKESYQPNAMYRPVTGYGAMMLSKEMAEGLRTALEGTN